MYRRQWLVTFTISAALLINADLPSHTQYTTAAGSNKSHGKRINCILTIWWMPEDIKETKNRIWHATIVIIKIIKTSSVELMGTCRGFPNTFFLRYEKSREYLRIGRLILLVVYPDLNKSRRLCLACRMCTELYALLSIGGYYIDGSRHIRMEKSIRGNHVVMFVVWPLLAICRDRSERPSGTMEE
jgi:hypothetical protein